MTTKQKSGILLSISIAGLLGTGVAAIWADRKANKLKSQHPSDEKQTVKDWANVNWPYAIPVTTASISIAAMICNQTIASKEMTRLAGVAGMSIAGLSQYKGAVREVAGDEVADKIEQNLAPIEPSETEASVSDVLMNKDVDAIACYDALTDTMFECAPTQVLEAWLEVNRRIAYGEYVEINDYLSMLGVDNKPEFYGLGWNYESVCSHGMYWVQFVPELQYLEEEDMDVLYINCTTPIDELSSTEFRR